MGSHVSKVPPEELKTAAYDNKIKEINQNVNDAIHIVDSLDIGNNQSSKNFADLQNAKDIIEAHRLIKISIQNLLEIGFLPTNDNYQETVKKKFNQNFINSYIMIFEYFNLFKKKYKEFISFLTKSNKYNFKIKYITFTVYVFNSDFNINVENLKNMLENTSLIENQMKKIIDKISQLNSFEHEKGTNWSISKISNKNKLTIENIRWLEEVCESVAQKFTILGESFGKSITGFRGNISETCTNFGQYISKTFSEICQSFYQMVNTECKKSVENINNCGKVVMEKIENYGEKVVLQMETASKQTKCFVENGCQKVKSNTENIVQNIKISVSEKIENEKNNITKSLYTAADSIKSDCGGFIIKAVGGAIGGGIGAYCGQYIGVSAAGLILGTPFTVAAVPVIASVLGSVALGAACAFSCYKLISWLIG